MTGEPITVDLFVRSLSPIGARARPGAVIDRLERLVEADVIDAYSVCVWGKEIELSSSPVRDEHTDHVVAEVESFRTWAADHGVTLDAFDQREVSTITGETHTVLTLPVMVLAEAVGAELTCVAPCTTSGGVLTVEDRLESLESEDEEPRLSEDGPSSRNDRSVRPHQLDAAQSKRGSVAIRSLGLGPYGWRESRRHGRVPVRSCWWTVTGSRPRRVLHRSLRTFSGGRFLTA